MKLSPVSVAATWRIVQAAAASALFAALLRAGVGIPYDTGGYCRACFEITWAWICALQGC